jgi:hypothetical protein
MLRVFYANLELPMISVRRFAKSALVCALGVIAPAVWPHEVSEDDHHAFEHKYSEQCIAREKNGSLDPVQVRELCECVAKEDSKRLTIDEVRKFVRENKYPVSLMMKSDAASSVCFQSRR